MENIKVEDSRIYMQENYSKYYDKMEKAISRFDENLRLKLENYYLNIVTDNKYKYYRDNVASLTSCFCNYLNELNNNELEFYIEFCLEFHEQNFLDILYAIYMICLKTNLVLKEICSCYLRYAGRKEREELFQKIFKDVVYINEDQNDEVLEILENIKELEKQHILNCYEKAKNGETFCDNCAPFCYVEKEKTKSRGSYKRTTPDRIY